MRTFESVSAMGGLFFGFGRYWDPPVSGRRSSATRRPGESADVPYARFTQAICESWPRHAFCLTGFASSARRRVRRSGATISTRILEVRPEPFAARNIRIPGASDVFVTAIGSWSDQDEIEQRDQGCAYAGGDQGIVGPEIGFRIVRWLAGVLGHGGYLRQAAGGLCELDHTRRIFFAAGYGTERRLPGLDQDAGLDQENGSGTSDMADQEATGSGCRCWSRPWKRFPVRNFVRCLVSRNCLLLCLHR